MISATRSNPMKNQPLTEDLKHRICWTDHERKLFEEALLRQFHKAHSKKKGWKRAAVKAAEEEALPPERRRGWTSLQRITQPFFKRMNDHPLPPPPEAPAPAAAPEPEPTVAPQAKEPGPEAAPPFPTTSVEEAVVRALLSVESFMDSLARAVDKVSGDGSGLRDFVRRLGTDGPSSPAGIAAAPAGPPPPRPPLPPRPPSKPMEKPRNMRVAVVGFLGDQFRHLKEKVQELPVDLIEINKDRNSTDFPTCERIILERHIDHRWSEMASRHLGRSRVAFVHGISEAAQRIADFHSQNVAEAISGVKARVSV